MGTIYKGGINYSGGGGGSVDVRTYDLNEPFDYVEVYNTVNSHKQVRFITNLGNVMDAIFVREYPEGFHFVCYEIDRRYTIIARDTKTTWDMVTEPFFSVPEGGEVGQVLAKKSVSAGDTEWVTQTVVLTQAEYDALSEDEKNSDTVYYITDAGGSDNIFYFKETLNNGVQTYDMTFAELKAAWDAKKVGVFVGGAGNAFVFKEFMYYSSADADGERLVFPVGDSSKIERIFTVRPDDSVTFTVNDTDWQTLTGDYFDIKYRKKNGIVYITWFAQTLKQASTAGTNINCILPEGFRPTQSIYQTVIANSQWIPGQVGIGTNGQMGFSYQQTFTTTQQGHFFGSFEYPVN